ncbi:alpha/beta fold hydrolase [Phreatobacter sp.]|uniref:alpha/beta hydrolase n=1 Tax=Phreatobacter sp. TaxID=1966341 RepID=UPI0022BEF62B|nr:alpha/beta fold hydrolase [Phreatobacter sp.]MCZ8314088.1 alpha/beta fold hydrolase [Phreatobacter sp.]
MPLSSMPPRPASALRLATLAAAALALGGCFGPSLSGITGSVSALTAPPSQPVATPVFVTSTRPAFTGDRLGAPSAERARFYRQVVSMPPGRATGSIPRPQITSENPRRHAMLADRDALTPDAFRRELAQTIAAKPFDQRDVLVYVHGFNTDYDEAAFRIVQVAADGGFRGTQVLFTWPSYRRVLAYSGDREVATASRDALEKLLSDLGRTPGVGRIHILAHSMGGFLTMEALRQASIAGNGELGGRLGEVILAAPDLDVEVFRQQMARIARPSRVSLFVQADDRALAASSTVAWDRQRVGALDVRNPQHRQVISSLGVRVFTMSATGWTDLIRHGTFAEAPEIVRLIGGKISQPPVIEDSLPQVAEAPPLPSELRAPQEQAPMAGQPDSARTVTSEPITAAGPQAPAAD